jgi:hypothetical protein
MKIKKCKKFGESEIKQERELTDWKFWFDNDEKSGKMNKKIYWMKAKRQVYEPIKQKCELWGSNRAVVA